jgi:hypothetical protein
VLAEEGVDFGYDVRFEREIVLDLQVRETTDAAALLLDLQKIAAASSRARRELARTLRAGWKVFHVQSGIDTRISCYDPTYAGTIPFSTNSCHEDHQLPQPPRMRVGGRTM